MKNKNVLHSHVVKTMKIILNKLENCNAILLLKLYKTELFMQFFNIEQLKKGKTR